MAYADERKTFRELSMCTHKQLLQRFDCEDSSSFYRFVEKNNSKNFITVDKKIPKVAFLDVTLLMQILILKKLLVLIITEN